MYLLSNAWANAEPLSAASVLTNAEKEAGASFAMAATGRETPIESVIAVTGSSASHRFDGDLCRPRSIDLGIWISSHSAAHQSRASTRVPMVSSLIRESELR